jgi:hypothetical protein
MYIKLILFQLLLLLTNCNAIPIRHKSLYKDCYNSTNLISTEGVIIKYVIENTVNKVNRYEKYDNNNNDDNNNDNAKDNNYYVSNGILIVIDNDNDNANDNAIANDNANANANDNANAIDISDDKISDDYNNIYNGFIIIKYKTLPHCIFNCKINIISNQTSKLFVFNYIYKYFPKNENIIIYCSYKGCIFYSIVHNESLNCNIILEENDANDEL